MEIDCCRALLAPGGQQFRLADLPFKGCATRISVAPRAGVPGHEDEDRLSDSATDMDAEDGRMWVYEDGVTAFTDFGIENLTQLIADLRA